MRPVHFLFIISYLILNIASVNAQFFNCTTHYSPYIELIEKSSIIISFTPKESNRKEASRILLKGNIDPSTINYLWNIVSDEDQRLILFMLDEKRGLGANNALIRFTNHELALQYEHKIRKFVRLHKHGNKTKLFDLIIKQLTPISTQYFNPQESPRINSQAMLDELWCYDALQSGKYFSGYQPTTEQETVLLNLLKSEPKQQYYEFAHWLNAPKIHRFILDQLAQEHQNIKPNFHIIETLETLFIHNTLDKDNQAYFTKLVLYQMARHAMKEKLAYPLAFGSPSYVSSKHKKLTWRVEYLLKHLNDKELLQQVESWPTYNPDKEVDFETLIPSLTKIVQTASKTLKICNDNRIMELPKAEELWKCY